MVTSIACEAGRCESSGAELGSRTEVRFSLLYAFGYVSGCRLPHDLTVSELTLAVVPSAVRATQLGRGLS